ncbi:MAG: nickel pincer cofactor biosynthesis protein LarC [Oscillospiraceae bacterium]|nr:nickel pincer cofactor biosynthesis protein LarC [Oscillospiraceae bacterium]
MKTLYLELGMGAAGDMLAAALTELLDEPEAFIGWLNRLNIPGVSFKREIAEKCGIRGSRMSVLIHGVEEHDHDHSHEHGHAHSGLRDIEHIVRDHMDVPERVKEDILAVYGLIAEAESRAHGVSITDIHFHEVGTMDAVADITAVCMLMAEIAPDRVIASPVCVGNGFVRCAHGVLPVPAPATADILRGVPIYGGDTEGELCTPTGAALLKHFVTGFEAMPVMSVSKIGYGMGKRDFGKANCVRAFLGDTEEAAEVIYELSCNLDDMTGEQIGFAMERLFEAGALDVYTTPIGMKKSRPGVLLRAICREEARDGVLQAMLRHTSTLGVREQKMRRYALARETAAVETPYGVIRRKTARGYGVSRSKFEYDDLAEAARKSGESISETERELDIYR